eukprot:TRINITY_DN1130_c0_g1_i3.p1 TRINITY_DN1130_c0_g1~~TRINITY_DN1130_c0_g1_i3.p1  ORF type:complete len:444 (-),score=79.97 TRINITY_DN1130_c0_g1_i3:64-1353(-)
MSGKNCEVLLTGDSSGQMYNLAVWDPDTGTFLSSFKGGSSAPHTCTFVGNDYILSAPPEKPLLNAWQINRNEQMSLRMFTPGKVNAMTTSPRGHYILIAVQEQISVYQMSTGRLWCVVSSHYQPVTCLTFTSDGSHFISAGADGQVLCWSLATVLSRRTLPGLPSGQVGKPEPKWSWREHALPVTDIAITAGGLQGKVFSVSQDQTCKAYCIVSGQILLSVAFKIGLTAVTTSINCDLVCVGAENGDIFQLSLRSPPRTVAVTSENMGESSTLKGHKSAITALSLSLDGSQLASGSSDKSVKLWHMKSGQCVRTIEHKGAITCLQYLIPPPGLLAAGGGPPSSGSSWQPARKLVPLLKGSDPNEAFKVNLLSKEDKAIERYQSRQDEVLPSQMQESTSNPENEGKLKELMEINHELYTFSLKHILHKSV